MGEGVIGAVIEVASRIVSVAELLVETATTPDLITVGRLQLADIVVSVIDVISRRERLLCPLVAVQLPT